MAVVRFSSLACLSVALLLSPLGAEAQKRSGKVRSLEKQRTEMLRKINATSQAIERIKKDSREEAKRLELLRKQVAQRKEVIAVLGQEVDELSGQMDELSGRIAKLRQREENLLSQYALSLKAMQRNDSERNKLVFLLSSENVSELRMRQNYLKKYALAAGRVADELKATREEIQIAQAEVSRVHQQKAEVLAISNQEKKALEQEEGQRATKVSKLQGEAKKLSQDLAKQKREAEQLDAKIQAQIAAEIAAAEERARKAEKRREADKKRREEAKRRAEERVRQNQEAARRREAAARKRQEELAKRKAELAKKLKDEQDAEARAAAEAESRRLAEQERAAAEADRRAEQEERRRAEEDTRAVEREEESERKSAIGGGYAMDAGERKLSGSFSQNRGRLPMPVRGRYELVRRFGTQQHDQHSRVHVASGGIDLRALGDRGAYAVFEGVISRVFVTPGYGQSIIIRHGNYLTVYANLSSVSVSSGQRVSAGTRLGSISSDDSSGRGNVLHFQLWHERTKLNPAQWIRL